MRTRVPGWENRGIASTDRPLSPSEYFGARARTYDDAYDAGGSGEHQLRARMAVVLDLAGSGPGDALDVGMGPGRLCAELARRGWTVSGVDGSQSMVDRARAQLGNNAATRLQRADAGALPFADASFDVVTATGVMEYIRDRSAALGEIVRVLRPGGIAVVSVPNPNALYARSYGPHMAAVDAVYRLLRGTRRPHAVGGGWIAPAAFADMLRAAELRVDAVRYAGYLLLPLPFDALFPVLSGRLARRIEGRGPRLGAMLATQIVFAARR